MEIYFRLAQKDELQEVTPLITSVATRKLNNLKKYLSNRKNLAKVYVELNKESGAHQQGNVWHTQINLDCDGTKFHAAATAEQVEASLMASIQELEKELRRYKRRNQTLLRKGGGLLKDVFRGFRTL